MSNFNLSIVVPVYNEADQVDKLIRRLRLLNDDLVADIIIVDGGSTDDTVERLSQQFNVIQSEKGRANQMNAGAKLANGTWVMFVHADTDLGPSHIAAAVSYGAMHKWGRFDVKLSGKGFSFRVIEVFINWRSRLTKVATGDQCIFVRKSVFDQLNGFTDMPLMEDVDLSKRLKRLGKPACLEKKVTTSSRRWEENGVVTTVLLMWKLRYLFWRGVSSEELAKLY
ncbi:MAG: rSAM/selenodomain-associated transferase 2 [Bermanella sp.]|jgi:rSAM/selenodomain-associated transferase 2